VRTYFHLDMDAFFVSVEELFDPSLKGKPVVVGGRPTSAAWCRRHLTRRASSASTRPCRCARRISCARKPFSSTAIPTATATTRTRSTASAIVFALVEMASIDEAYLDMTGTERLYGPPCAPPLLHERMKAETGLKLFHSGSPPRAWWPRSAPTRQAQRRAMGDSGQEPAFLAPLDVRKIPGVGKVTEKQLNALGIRKVGDLARLDEAFLDQRFGKWAWRWPANRAAWMPAAGSTAKSARTMARNHQPRAHILRGHHGPGADRIHSGAPVRNGGPPFARAPFARAHHSAQAALLRFLDLHARASVARATDLDTELFEEIRELFRRNWKTGAAVRLLGCTFPPGPRAMSN